MSFDVEPVIFGKYFEDKRISHGVTIEELAEGICNFSLITKIESGERVSSMLMRNRLLERMGATSEEYEKFVSVEEFESWKKRIAIVDLVSQRKCEEAKLELKKYLASISEKDILEEQFCYDMMAMIAKLENDATVVEYAETALRKTVVLDANGIAVNRKLAPKEINLLIEYSLGLKKEIRHEQLIRLIRYTDENIIDERNLALFFPKLVCVYTEEYLPDYEKDIAWLIQAMKMVNRALDCLSKTDKLMYVLELASIKERVWQFVLKSSECNTTRGYEIFLESKKKNAKEYELWKNLGDEFGVDMRSEDWCFLHTEEGVKCIGDIIRRRRNMIGMSSEEACMDICSVETLERIEKLKRNPQPKRMRKLFERLGLAGEYQRTFIAVTDCKMKKCEDDITTFSNNMKYEEALSTLKYMKGNALDKSPENEQYFLMTESMLKSRKKEITLLECEKRIKKALMYTVPVFDLTNGYYFTRIELSCIYNMVMIEGSNNPSRMADFVVSICDSMTKDSTLRDIRTLELFLLAAGKISTGSNDYDGADGYLDTLIRLELINKRSSVLYPAINKKAIVINKREEAGIDISGKHNEKYAEFLKALKEYKQTVFLTKK